MKTKQTDELLNKTFAIPKPPPRIAKPAPTGKAEKRYKVRDGAGPYRYYLTPSEKKAQKEWLEEFKISIKYNDQV